MTYTPSQTFTFNGGDYTPSTAFDFNPDPIGAVAVTLAGLTATISAELPPAATLAGGLDDTSGMAYGEVSLYKLTVAVTLEAVGIDSVAAIAPQGKLQLPIIEYTPGGLFEFNAIQYTPATVFEWAEPIASLDPVNPKFTGNYYDNGASAAVTLDPATITTHARYIDQRANVNITIDAVQPGISAVNVPQAESAITLDAVSLTAPTKYVDYRASADVTLDAVNSDTNAVNAPQANLSITLDAIQPSINAVNAPQVESAITLDAVTVQARGNFVDQYAQAAITLDDCSVTASGFFDYNVTRYLVGAWHAPCDATKQTRMTRPMARQAAQPAPIALNATREQAARLPIETQAPIDQTELTRLERCGTVDSGTRIDSNTASPVEQLQPLPLERCGTVDEGAFLFERITAGFDQLIFERSLTREHKQDSGQTVHTFIRTIADEPPHEHRYTPGLAFTFEVGSYTPLDAFAWPFTMPRIHWAEGFQLGGIRHGVDSSFQYATPAHARRCSIVEDARRPPPGTSPPIDPEPPPPPPPSGEQIIIPEQTVYFMQHQLSVTLIDLTPIAVESVSLSLDADSFAWQFRAQLLDKADLAHVTAQNGQPVTLIVTINGAAWHVLVERIEHSRQFAQRNITLSGRGLTALLGQPYEQPASATQGSLLAIQQLAALHLPNGWTLDWQHVTWNVPGGAYSYTQQTPIQALTALANDIGAVVIPARDSQTLTVQARYPVLPWSFDAATPDVIIPESAVLSLSQRPVIPYQANGVYVHGGEVGGVMGWCRLNGTDGARLAPTVSNVLITDVIAARALGERILAGQYEQPAIQSATLPMDGDTLPLLEIGQLVQITSDATPIKGIINSVSIDASLASVRQTIQIGEETPNTWALFKELLPRDPLLVATLSSTDGVTSLMTLLDGGVVRVRGTGTVGNQYYIRSGRIDGDAPNLTLNEVVI